MTWPAWFTLAVAVALVVGLVRDLVRADLLVLGTLGVLLLGGVVTPEAAFAGFANPSVVTIGALFVVAAGVERTGVLSGLDRLIMPRHARLPTVLLRLLAPVALLSSFLNNTPVVAMLIPRVQAVAARTGIPASKLLIPLSYAAMAGGMATLIGTSTNLVADGLLRQAGYQGFGLFEFAWVGVPAALFAVAYLAFAVHRLLPAGVPTGGQAAHAARSYQFELKVPAASVLVGQTIAEADLRALEDAYLIHIRRDHRVIGPASPAEVLQAGDVLTFSGQPAAMERLLLRPGLARKASRMPHENGREELPLFEAVVSAHSSLVGRTLREVGFRDRYQGVVLAIHRRSEQLRGALGTVPLQAGDLLLVEARPGFDARWNHHQDFYLVAPCRGERLLPPLSRKGPVALLLLAGMIGLNVTGLLPLTTAAIAAAMGMVVLGCLPGTSLRRSVDLSVLVTIAAAFGVGNAVEASGLAGALAHGLTDAAQGLGPLAVLAALYLATMLLTEIITNSAAAVLMVPIALAAAVEGGLDPRASVLTVAIAASASFLTPIGYQTNLMVMGAGGYRARDYFRAGLPLSLGIMAITLAVVYLKWM